MHAKIDLPYEELDESILQTDTTKGLTDAEVEVRLEMFGKNELPEVKVNPWLKFLGYFLCPTSLLFELACILSVILKEYPDLFLLVPALIANAFIRFFQEAQAESALDALKSTLTLKTRAETEIPGDIIAIRVGDIIPADCRLLGIGIAGEITEGVLRIDQSSLAGKSSPVVKGKGHIVYSSSIVEQGAMLVVVTKTGSHTYIGRTTNLISRTYEDKYSQNLIKIIRSVLVIIIILTLFMSISVLGRFLFRAFWIEVLKRIVFIAIAAIPLGLPTVMSVIMAVGVKGLAKKKVIVKRLTAIEDLASISILCSAKTGTLTSNKLSIDKPYLANKGSTSTDFVGTGEQYTEDDLLLNSFFSSDPGSKDPIESVIRKTAQTNVKLLRNRKEQDHHIPGYKVNNFTPFNPSSKYSEGKVSNLTTGEQFRVIKGAPQVIIKLCGGHQQATDAVNNLAARGFRALGVAKTVDEDMTRFELIGLISIVDPPRKDSAATIQECNNLGVNVKMITGDQQVIAKEVAHRLGMQRTILDAQTLVDTSIFEEDLIDRCVKCDGFAHVIPEHKYQVVDLLQKRGYLVGMIGDGVNDVPALKKANVGVAVEGCTEAARSAADIVLLDEGLSTIVDGIKCCRTIFQRMRWYAFYRIATTVHILLFVSVTAIMYDFFFLPDLFFVLIAVLNDAASLLITVDSTRVSQRPVKWRLEKNIVVLSFIMGILLLLMSFVPYLAAKYSYPYDLNDRQYYETYNFKCIQRNMYMNLSLCSLFLIYSTRLESWWWKSMPSWTFVTGIISSLLAVVFLRFAIDGSASGEWVLIILGISLAMFILVDIVKVIFFRLWSFLFTTTVASTLRISKNIRKVRIAFRVIMAVNAFKKPSHTIAKSKSGKEPVIVHVGPQIDQINSIPMTNVRSTMFNSMNSTLQSSMASSLYDVRLRILKRMAGAGGVGQVYKAVYGGIEAVAKIPFEPEHERLVYEESRVMSALNHPNVVQSLAFMSDAMISIPGKEEARRTALLVEFMNLGTFSTYCKERSQVRDNGDYSLVKSQTLDMFTQAVRGIEYMHKKEYCHLDLKPDNILIHKEKNGTLIAKVSDMGSTVKIGTEASVLVYVFKFWSFEFTAMVWPTKAQKEKLAARKARKIVVDRATKNIKKVKTAFRVIMAVNAFKNPSPAIAKNKSANEPVIVQVGSSETISA
ncbi:hypothetical protein HDV02_003796 [Globomyces sp. JEL0801]|nr:hypothetical protein HDV02_003796 [Globomyces sp. JEL0801]